VAFNGWASNSGVASSANFEADTSDPSGNVSMPMPAAAPRRLFGSL
jgi:hypothetical protein